MTDFIEQFGIDLFFAAVAALLVYGVALLFLSYRRSHDAFSRFHELNRELDEQSRLGRSVTKNAPN